MPQDDPVARTPTRGDTPAPSAGQAKKVSLKRSRREQSVISISSSSDSEGRAKRRCLSGDSDCASFVEHPIPEPPHSPHISLPLPRSKKSRGSLPMLHEDERAASRRQSNNAKDELQSQSTSYVPPILEAN